MSGQTGPWKSAAGDDGEVIRHAWGTRSNATAATATFSKWQVENARSRRPGSAPQEERQTDATPNDNVAGSGQVPHFHDPGPRDDNQEELLINNGDEGYNLV